MPELPSSSALTLRPGVRVHRRNAREWQVGLRAPRSVVLTDDPATRRLLRALLHGEAATEADPRSVARLRAAGLVLTGDPLAAEQRRGRGRRRLVAALLAEQATESALAARSQARIVVRAGGPDGPEFAAQLERLLAASGINPCGSADELVDAVVLVWDGHQSRTGLDGLMRASIPHLLVTLSEARWTLGPFVNPGRTACVRCVDAARAEADPHWPVLVESPGATGAHQSHPSPAEPTLTAVALSLAAAQVTSYVDGFAPPTWSAQMHVDHRLDLTTSPSDRHPGCGCCWEDLWETG